MVTSGARIDFYACTRWRKCPRAFFSRASGQFPRRNSLAVLTEVHLGPCVYADLTLKCSHKLDPLAAKGWKNLSVRMSPVYIIVVLARRARIKRKKIVRVFLPPVCCIRLRDCRQIIFLLPNSSARIRKFVATILMLFHHTPARFRKFKIILYIWKALLSQYLYFIFHNFTNISISLLLHI